jgi:hypothetical protein
MHPTRPHMIMICLLVVLLGMAAHPAAATQPNRPDCENAFVRTELFFGSAKPDGGAVTEEEFSAFLDQVITPRFPDGLTLLTGLGQFRNSAGIIVKEQSFLLILLYPRPIRDSSARIEEIRDLYKAQFQQESVLRVDGGTVKACF